MYLLDDFALVVAGSEVVKIDDLLNIGLHVADELELHIELSESVSDLVKALVNYGCIAHLSKSTRYACT